MTGQDHRTALVVGARGVIGGTLAEHIAGLPGWDAVGLSRRGGRAGAVRHVSADLFDPASVRAALRDHPHITHVFYAAYQDRPSWSELVAPNVTMLQTVLDALPPAVEHVSLMQGYKVYGAHLGPFATPARESDPPHMPPEFNVDQQQLVESRAATGGWTWSAIRPSVVVGFGLGNPLNLGTVLAVYAAISKELGVPLRFPGKPGAYDALLELTDAGLLAEATVWAATEPAAANQAFNIANGDLVPLEPPVARARRRLRPRRRPAPADVARRRDGRQGGRLGRDGRSARPRADPVRGRVVLGVRRLRLLLGLRHVRRHVQGPPVRASTATSRPNGCCST